MQAFSVNNKVIFIRGKWLGGMAEQHPKRPRGRPRKEGDDELVRVKLPKHHFEYLNFLVTRKYRLGTTVNDAAKYILIRELDKMFTSGYHNKNIPEK